MTEREKMLAGELYSPRDKELRAMHLHVKKLLTKFNKINLANEKKYKKLIKNAAIKRLKSENAILSLPRAAERTPVWQINLHQRRNLRSTRL